jgi:hypothetical protein
MKLPKSIDKNLLLKIGAGVGAYFFIVKPLLQKLNLMDDKDDKEVSAAAKFPGFNPSFWREALKTPGVKKVAVLTAATTLKFTKQIATAIKLDPTEINEEAINDVFKRLKSQVQLSQISDLYAKMFNSDLFGDLKSKLTSNEFVQNIDLIKKYALYHPDFK